MKVSELLANESSWMKGRLACDAQDRNVGTRATSAVKFCLAGAIEHCCSNSLEVKKKLADLLIAKGKVPASVIDLLKDSADNVKNNVIVMRFNDANNTTYKEVIELLKELDI